MNVKTTTTLTPSDITSRIQWILEALPDLKSFWIKGEMINNDSCVEYDGQAVACGYISITPIQFTLTNELYINQLKKKILDE